MADDPPLTLRLMVVAVVAPVVGAAVAATMVILAGFALGELTSAQSEGMGFVYMYFIVFGAPLALMLQVGVGVPLYGLLKSRGSLDARSVTLAGAVAGGVLLGGLVTLGTGRAVEVLVALLIGGAGGAASATVLWHGALKDRAL